ncbi:hypothetical protein BLA24_31525 [Streptomyces cinnamoneus]|uniref:Secreted protein n=1 Tax=Streptomyces cinnamoneus TaxID=53446 RepID=A0A2G1X9T7_STRCJ|nr:hypothetical protein [Streptomyces cinnamoneus]PHQ47988.1 hypothetical protein BLA24_31525 [Streptomyces cinnamoneus]
MKSKPVFTAPVASALLGALTLTALGGLAGCAPAPAPGRAGTDGSRASGMPAPAGSVDLGQWITSFTDRVTQDGHYRVPTPGERRAVADGVRLLLDGDPSGAERKLATVGYGLRTLADRAGGRRYAEIADATKDGEATRGWGRVYVALGGPARWAVQVPHPTADQRTEQLGVGLLRGAPGGVLVLAGAHRAAAATAPRTEGDGTPSDAPADGDAADVAHRADSVFAAVSDALADRRLPAVQVHGFADSSLPDHDVVVSPGKGDAGLPDARRLSAALRREDLRACEVWQRYCGRLEGRTNVEGDYADTVGVPFLHVEHSRRVRADDQLLASAVRALTDVVKRWAAGRT